MTTNPLRKIVLVCLGICIAAIGWFLYRTPTDTRVGPTTPLSSSVSAVASLTPVNFYGTPISFVKLFGQKQWGETIYDTVTADQIHHAAGIAVDQSTQPPKVYVVDSGNNRILAFSDISTTRPAGQFALGQTSLAGSACNGDNNIGMFGPASAQSLCLTPYSAAPNIEEYSMRLNIDVDSVGNIYVPDLWNNRVLRYNQPFSTDKTGGKGDTIADFVWGQPNFTDNKPNQGRGETTRNAQTLHIAKKTGSDHVSARGVSIDTTGNVWVADAYNFRVLRYPSNSKTADLVIGQTDFTGPANESEIVASCQTAPQNRPLNKVCTPTLARVHPQTGKLYVLDESPPAFQARILVFSPPFQNGKSADYQISPKQPGPFTNSNWAYTFQSNGFIFNTYRQGAYTNGTLWVTEHQSRRTLLIDDAGNIVKVIGAPDTTTVGCDYAHYNRCGQNIADNYNLCWAGGAPALANTGPNGSPQLFMSDEHFHRIARINLPYDTAIVNGNTCLPVPTQGIAPGIIPNTITANGLAGTSIGLAVWDRQLIVKDKLRYVIWDDYTQDKSELSSPVILGQTSGDVRTPNELGSRSQHAVDDTGRLWFVNVFGELEVYQLPLQSHSVPISAHTKLYWADDPASQVVVNTGESAVTFDPLNKAIWLTDHRNHRVLRIKNYHDIASGKLLVDAVLGQPNKQSTKCNLTQQENWIAGGPPAANTLCNPQFMQFDRLGNFYIVENTYECHGNNRIIMYEAADMKNISTMFPLLSAKKVFVRKSLTEQAVCNGPLTNEPFSPVGIAFDSMNHMVVGNDGYYPNDKERVSKQLWYYCDPLKKDAAGYVQGQKPDASINIPLGSPGELTFDAQDNLLVQDHTWAKVWMLNYRTDPQWLVPVNGSQCIPPPTTPTPTRTPTNLPTPSVTQSPTRVPTPGICPGLAPIPASCTTRKTQGDADCDGVINLADLAAYVRLVNGHPPKTLMVNGQPYAEDADFTRDCETGLKDRDIIIQTLKST